jgi:hypothetical protein
MLLGCWLLAESLQLQAGQLRGLLLLMGALQVYEALLVGLGSLLVRGRAPRDGATVLLLETLFLMDAPLLAAECVTVDARVGTVVAAAALGLAAAKLAWVRRAAPALLSRRAAVVLWAHAAVVLALPALAAHLAGARLLSPRALWLLWWGTLALPLAARWLFEEASARAGADARRALATWATVPAAMVLLHLWAVGYIHAIPFQPAFFAPLLLGLALAAPRGQLGRQVALPAAGLVLSLGQGHALGFVLPGAGEVTPLRVALLTAAAAWGVLAWRDRRLALGLLAAGSGLASLVGPSGPGLLAWLGEGLTCLLRPLDRVRPRGAFGWGVVGVVAAFVFLAAGVRRSLRSAREG